MALLLLLQLGACETPVDSGDEPDACADPVYTWDSWGAGFFGSYCRACHSEGTPDRRGAPPGVDFDTEAQVRSFSASILRSVVDDGTMPVGGGVPEAEVERLQAWLACGDGGEAFIAPILEPVYAPEEVQAHAVEVIESAPMLPFWLHEWLEGYLATVQGVEGCPEGEWYGEGDWTMNWTGRCHEADRELYGDIIVFTDSRTEPDDLINTWELFSLSGERFSDHEEILAGGYGQFLLSEEPLGIKLHTFWGGRYYDPTSVGPAQQRLSAGISAEGIYLPGGYDGWVTGGLAVGDSAVDLRQLTFRDRCIGPSGTVAVRDPSTAWWTVELRDDCSGCGELVFDGVVYGESCIGADIAALLQTQILEAAASQP